MTLQSKKKIANRIRLLQQRLERENFKLISKVFKDFANEIEEQINKDELFEIDFSNFTRAIKRNLFKIYSNSSKKTVQWCKTLFGWKLEGSVIERVSNNVLNEYNEKYSAEKVTYVTDSTKKAIRDIVKKGQAAGKNYKDIAKDIQKGVWHMSEGRAKRIALTETGNAVNITTHATAIEAGMSKKTWLHVGGGFEDRESHLALDGKTIKVDEYFVINGNRALHPHDQSLPVGEIVNCHCICTYE